MNRAEHKQLRLFVDWMRMSLGLEGLYVRKTAAQLLRDPTSHWVSYSAVGFNSQVHR